MFPSGTDLCDLYTNDWYSNAPRLANGMYYEPYPKSTLTTVGDHTPRAQTSLQQHCLFRCNGIEHPPNAGEWSTLLRDDMKIMQSAVPLQGAYISCLCNQCRLDHRCVVSLQWPTWLKRPNACIVIHRLRFVLQTHAIGLLNTCKTGCFERHVTTIWAVSPTTRLQ